MGLSFGEIIVIVLVAFLVLGPDKLPEAGRTLGKTVNSFKKALSDSNLNLKASATLVNLSSMPYSLTGAITRSMIGSRRKA